MLIYNPTSGLRRQQREEQFKRAAAALINEGHSVEVAATTAAGSAINQAREASATADAIFACGGDGTIHEVMQALVSETGKHTCALGVIPLGSANALARHLCLPLDPRAAALAQIRGQARTIPIGKLTWVGGVRYFAVMAGAGPDGALAYSLLSAQKSRIGRLAYYLHAARLFATRRFPSFEVETRQTENDIPVVCKAVSVMAVRVDNLGGIFSGLTSRAASIHDQGMQLVILRPPATISLPLWFLTGWIGAHRFNPLLRTADATSFACRPLNGSAPHFQADGEWLGSLPFTAQLIPNALRLLLPSVRQ
jgi:YegS/Rv2252/BmrU family lipid kinase